MKIESDKTFPKRECPSCGMDVDENNNRCPICKYAFPNRTPGEKGYRLFLGLLLLLLFLSLTFGYLR